MAIYPEWTAKDLADKLAKGEKINLVDVRERDEWEEGHIAEARLVPLSEIAGRIEELNLEDTPVVLICRSGGRSGRVCDYLHEQGVSVVNIAGGMLSWNGEVVTGE